MTPMPWGSKPAKPKTLLQELPEILAGITQYDEPPELIAPYEVVLGDVSEDVKKLWTLLQCLGEDAMEFVDSLPDGQERTNSQRGYYDRLHLECSALHALLWHTVKTQKNCFHLSHIGLRCGWKLVTWVDQPRPRPESFASAVGFMTHLD